VKVKRFVRLQRAVEDLEGDVEVGWTQDEEVIAEELLLVYATANSNSEVRGTSAHSA